MKQREMVEWSTRTCITYAVEVHVGGLGHVVVEDNVDTLNVHAAAKQIRGHQDAIVEALELVVVGQTRQDEEGVER